MNLLDNDLFKPQETVIKNRYHVRIHQRNGKKSITTLEGLEEDLDLKRICKAMRKCFNCNGNVKKDDFDEEIIQLQGDQRENIKQWLLDQQIVEKSDATRIILHGF
jgi:translation initiation factor 1